MSNAYKASRTLPVRVELIRQIKRRRTFISYLMMVLLPLLVVAAVKFGPSSSGGGSSSGSNAFGGGGLNLVGLATNGAWNFTIVMIFFASGFLLNTVVALFYGDVVASEASWATLRYLLAAPVPRRKLLRTKLIVSFMLTLGAMLTLLVASYLIGWAAFGNGDLVSPVGGSFSNSEALFRVLVISAYIFTALLFTAGLAFFIGVRTDVPLGAVGTAVMVVIVLQILDAIDALGSIREWLPGHYAQSWTDALGSSIEWASMARGAAMAFALFTVLVGAAYLKFDRKDVLS
jgi:ABC-2 type transport system permease protein